MVVVIVAQIIIVVVREGTEPHPAPMQGFIHTGFQAAKQIST